MMYANMQVLVGVTTYSDDGGIVKHMGEYIRLNTFILRQDTFKEVLETLLFVTQYCWQMLELAFSSQALQSLIFPTE